MADRSLDRVSSGVDGLDEIIRGGFIEGRNDPVHGPPGTGKTVLGFHFLTDGSDERR
ncbi:ATPase domain-containing protein [Halorientalis salina]|uniref:ATPase domain-containing protein n=1 Tax=Halorientalis salina TaxID=2932266 RepID=UPI0010AC3A71|nr:ATPase domain-containing protein [Halorientalis salina]